MQKGRDRERREDRAAGTQKSRTAGRSKNTEQSRKTDRSRNAERGERPEKSRGSEKSERPEKSRGSEKSERPEKSRGPEKSERPEKSREPEKDQRAEKGQRPEIVGRPEKSQRPEKDQRTEKSQRPKIVGRPEKSQRPEKSRGPEKDQRTEKSQRPKIVGRPEKSQRPEKNRNRGSGRDCGSAYAADRVSVSQNFITDHKLIRRIVHLSAIGKNDTVLEIGTGKGHLTEALCQEAGYVYSVEIDRRLYESAGKRLARQENLKLIHGDFLRYDLPAKGDWLVFANIPFFITTQIVEKLTGWVNKPKEIWLIMEKGAAKRFLGLTGENEKSLLLKVYWNMEICYHFRREDFHPMPSVDSVLLHFSLKPEPDLSRKEYGAFRSFIEQAMRYGICGKGGMLTNRQAAAALKRAGLPHAHEDGVTLYIQWLFLFRCWHNQKKD